MAYDSDNKTSADLQRELDQQRALLEDRIDQIQQKLSPGQLVDELLAYTKGGGGEFVSGLQRQVTANPLPVAMLGVSLAWLMSRPAPSAESHRSHNRHHRHDSDRRWDDSINANRGYGEHDVYEDYPVATISGSSLQRVSHTPDESGNHYSEWLDDAGKKYRAASDALGRRAGHFRDEAGNTYKGFVSGAGERITHFRDETGNLLDEASGWASHTWQRAREMMHDARDGIAHGRDRAGQAGQGVINQVDSLNHRVMEQFRDQPLIGGALAFALGAALGAALPHTRQEDELIGDAADAVKAKAGEEASHLYEQGREKAAEIYEEASGRAGELYQQAANGLQQAATNGLAATESPDDGQPRPH